MFSKIEIVSPFCINLEKDFGADVKIWYLPAPKKQDFEGDYQTYLQCFMEEFEAITPEIVRFINPLASPCVPHVVNSAKRTEILLVLRKIAIQATNSSKKTKDI